MRQNGRLSVRVEDTLKDRLEKLALQTRRTPSQLVNLCLESALPALENAPGFAAPQFELRKPAKK